MDTFELIEMAQSTMSATELGSYLKRKDDGFKGTSSRLSYLRTCLQNHIAELPPKVDPEEVARREEAKLATIIAEGEAKEIEGWEKEFNRIRKADGEEIASQVISLAKDHFA